jgi:hypothetical protein
MGQDRESLRDLDGVRVSVDDLPLSVSGGVSRERIQQAVEAQLRQAGIRVLTTGDFPVGDPFLRVRVNAAASPRCGVAYTVDVDFVQMVFMRRNPAVTFNRAETWRAAPALGTSDSANLAADVMRTLYEEVRQFIDDYQVVNKT